MARRNNQYCCECDLCSLGECKGAAWVVFLTDYLITYDYYMFCDNHQQDARRYIQHYLATHPGVAIDAEHENDNFLLGQGGITPITRGLPFGYFAMKRKKH